MVVTVPHSLGLGGTAALQGSGDWDAEPVRHWGLLALSPEAVRGRGQHEARPAVVGLPMAHHVLLGRDCSWGHAEPQLHRAPQALAAARFLGRLWAHRRLRRARGSLASIWQAD